MTFVDGNCCLGWVAGWLAAATDTATDTAGDATGAAAPIGSAFPNELETVVIVLLRQRTFIPNSDECKNSLSLSHIYKEIQFPVLISEKSNNFSRYFFFSSLK